MPSLPSKKAIYNFLSNQDALLWYYIYAAQSIGEIVSTQYQINTSANKTKTDSPWNFMFVLGSIWFLVFTFYILLNNYILFVLKNDYLTNEKYLHIYSNAPVLNFFIFSH